MKAHVSKRDGLTAPTRWDRKIRIAVLSFYGNACKCCGESRTKFLTLDHVGGGGKAHRAKIRAQGYGTIDKWVWSFIKLGHTPPVKLQILCQNCNHALGHYGCCPHQDSLTGTVKEAVLQATLDEARWWHDWCHEKSGACRGCEHIGTLREMLGQRLVKN